MSSRAEDEIRLPCHQGCLFLFLDRIRAAGVERRPEG